MLSSHVTSSNKVFQPEFCVHFLFSQNGLPQAGKLQTCNQKVLSNYQILLPWSLSPSCNFRGSQNTIQTGGRTPPMRGSVHRRDCTFTWQHRKAQVNIHTPSKIHFHGVSRLSGTQRGWLLPHRG